MLYEYDGLGRVGGTKYNNAKIDSILPKNPNQYDAIYFVNSLLCQFTHFFQANSKFWGTFLWPNIFGLLGRKGGVVDQIQKFWGIFFPNC